MVEIPEKPQNFPPQIHWERRALRAANLCGAVWKVCHVACLVYFRLELRPRTNSLWIYPNSWRVSMGTWSPLQSPSKLASHANAVQKLPRCGFIIPLLPVDWQFPAIFPQMAIFKKLTIHCELEALPVRKEFSHRPEVWNWIYILRNIFESSWILKIGKFIYSSDKFGIFFNLLVKILLDVNGLWNNELIFWWNFRLV